MQGILSQIRYFGREISKSFKKDNFIFLSKTNCMSSVSHSDVIRMYWYVIPMSLVCNRMHPYFTHMYSYVILMSLVCTRMSSVCHSYVLVCHPYVTRMYSYVTCMSLVCGFTMNPWRCSVRKGVLRNCSLRPATLFKKRLWHKCFPVNYAKFLRTTFLQNTSGRLLL